MAHQTPWPGGLQAGSIDVEALAPDAAYKILVGAVQPRPIAWVSTVSEDQTRNLAPFSFFTVASRDPATVLLSLTTRVEDGRAKDTLTNVRATGELVVNIPSLHHVESVQATLPEVGAEIDEFALAGLEAVPSLRVAPPRVAGIALALECVLDRTIDVGRDTLILARVLQVHYAPGVLDERLRVDNDLLKPLARLAGPWYGVVENEIPAPAVQARAGVA